MEGGKGGVPEPSHDRKHRNLKIGTESRVQIADALGKELHHPLMSKLWDSKTGPTYRHAAQANASLFTKMQQDHTLALANLAMATKSNITLVALLMKTILELSIQVANLTAKLVTAQFENTWIKK